MQYPDWLTLSGSQIYELITHTNSCCGELKTEKPHWRAAWGPKKNSFGTAMNALVKELCAKRFIAEGAKLAACKKERVEQKKLFEELPGQGLQYLHFKMKTLCYGQDAQEQQIMTVLL